MIIYIDLLFLLNCYISFNYFIFINETLKIDIRTLKVIIFSIIISIPTFIINVEINTIYYILFLYIIITIYSFKNSINIIKLTTLLLILYSGVLNLLYLNIKITYIVIIILFPILNLIIYFNKNIINTRNLYYKCKVKYNKRYLYYIGYLDTGNTLLEENIPVIFLKNKLDNIIKPKEISFNIINGKSNTSIYLHKDFYIYLKKKWIQKIVYIAYDKNLTHKMLLNKYILF